MTTSTDLVDLALLACGSDLGAPGDWVRPEFFRNSLALSVIESVQATRSHYTSVTNVLERYRAYRAEAGEDAAVDGALELMASFEALGGVSGWAERIGNRKPVSTRAGAPRKAEVIAAAAALLIDLGVDSADDLRALNSADFTRLRSGWTALPGQRSGLTWRYLAVHTGITPVGDDPLVRNYLGGTATEGLLSATAERLGVEPARLAYALWRHQSGRPVGVEARSKAA